MNKKIVGIVITSIFLLMSFSALGQQISNSNEKQIIPNNNKTPVVQECSFSFGITRAGAFVVASDPDGDDIKFGLDVDKDGEIDKWSDWYDVGTLFGVTHVFSQSTINYPDTAADVHIYVEDQHGARSHWANPSGGGRSLKTPLLKLISNNLLLSKILQQFLNF